MKWFKHDADASSDAKIKKLVIRYGAIGYAIYFHCLELIAGNISETNITFELEHDAEIIADNLKIKGTADKAGVDIVNEVMQYIVQLGLFESQNNHIFCFKLLKRLDSSMTSSTKMRGIITEAKQSHDIVMTESCKTTLDKTTLDKTRTEEKKEKRFSKPSLQEVEEYCKERSNRINAEQFISFYDAKGWMIGKNKMVDWRGAIRTWEQRDKKTKDTPLKHAGSKEAYSVDMSGYDTL